jgi:long-chain acyl-CoA synthetase
MSTQETTGTMADLVLEGAEKFGDGTALKHKEGDEWVESSYEDLGKRARGIAKGLMALGLEKGDAVAIFSDTRPEWVEADLGAACAGLVVATIYHTGSAEEAQHVLDNSESRLCFCEDEELLDKVKEVRGDLSGLEHLVLFEDSDDDAISLDELVEKGEGTDDSDLDARVEDIGPDDLFTLVYTSGTTGAPKGCMLTHGNFRAGLEMLDESVEITEDAVFYAFLPLSHVLTRLIELAALQTGATLAFWQRDKDKLMEDLREIQPTHLAAVPRIFEKIYNEAAAKAEGGIKGKVFSKAVEVGREVRELERKGDSPGPVLKGEYQLADKQIFSTVRDLFGGHLELAITGAAPVAKEMLEFFDACGVLVLEGYGLTETSGGATVNLPDDFKFGTQGKALSGVELKIAEREDDDEDSDEEGEDPGGEVLIRGPNVFKGYYRNEEATEEDLDDEGWFSSGDVGSIDDDGFLTITGRTKDIVVTSSGKNIPAARIENEISDNRWISQAVVYGDEKNYLVALITIDEDERSKLASEAGVDDDAESMAQSDEVREEIWKAIEEANGNFAKIEQVKKFTILEHDLSQDEGEITPTMKVKRNAVYENHRDRFEALYDED